jgi:probable HAF family extracellular repeat protein
MATLDISGIVSIGNFSKTDGYVFSKVRPAQYVAKVILLSAICIGVALLMPTGAPGGTLCGLNSRGQAVGASNLEGDLLTHPFLWSKTEGMKDLGTLGGTFGHPDWINDVGEVVGFSLTPGDLVGHAFLWRGGVMTDLGTVGTDPDSEGNSINAQGQVVGTSFDLAAGIDLHGFLWEHGGPIVDLNTLVPPGSGLTVLSALDINDRGEIAGNAVLPNGDLHAVLLIPCDEDHSEIEGCDFNTVDSDTAARVRPAQITAPSAESSFANLSPAESNDAISFYDGESQSPLRNAASFTEVA